MARKPWTPGIVRARRIEAQYARQLRKVAYHVGELATQLDPEGDLTQAEQFRAAMDRYAEAILPWAQAVANTMLREVDRRDLQAWQELTADMRRGLRDELANAPTGQATKAILADQVRLITSLPTEAARRVHDWTLEGVADGTRAANVSAAIQRTGLVTVARANLIARTEVARTASVLCQARAEHIGSRDYIWRSSGDADVRPTHRKLNGTVQQWANPPECDPPHRAHAGAIFNCRCWPEPILPE